MKKFEEVLLKHNPQMSFKYFVYLFILNLFTVEHEIHACPRYSELGSFAS